MGQPINYGQAPATTARSFWLRGPGLIFLVAGAGLAVLGVLALAGVISRPTATDDIKVKVVKCDAAYLSAGVDLEVTNASKHTVTATLAIEYRDEAGRRIDTDSKVIRDIAPGDTVRTSEPTWLDADPGQVSCEVKVTGVSQSR